MEGWKSNSETYRDIMEKVQTGYYDWNTALQLFKFCGINPEYEETKLHPYDNPNYLCKSPYDSYTYKMWGNTTGIHWMPILK